ncbi:MAG TPA: glycoside hydrolase family 130 protein [Candidatus Aminicenantes bacterium]|nr:glycoside hydrolase family 130 protein [Candidatus Aminicenantes bacterium]
MTRHPANPILTRADVPDLPPLLTDATSVFNPGAAKAGGRYVLMLRVQARSRETFTMVAEGRDGVRFAVRPEVVELRGLGRLRERVYHVYDPRVTRLEGAYYVMFAMDMDGGCGLGLARTADFEAFDFLGLVSSGDVRNGVLFPEKVGGAYLRFERPNRARHAGGPATGTEVWLAESDDLVRWRPRGPVMAGRFHYWDEYIGSGPPPVKTRRGWLHVYHGVATHFGSSNIYQAGVALFDLADPSRLLGRSRGNILEPREPYELCGQVPNVVFPSGMVVEDTDAEGFALESSPVKVYYGAADTAVGLALTTVGDLLAAASENEPG